MTHLDRNNAHSLVHEVGNARCVNLTATRYRKVAWRHGTNEIGYPLKKILIRRLLDTQSVFWFRSVLFWWKDRMLAPCQQWPRFRFRLNRSFSIKMTLFGLLTDFKHQCVTLNPPNNAKYNAGDNPKYHLRYNNYGVQYKKCLFMNKTE